MGEPEHEPEAPVPAATRWTRSRDALWRSTLDAVVLLSAGRSDTDPLVVDGPGVQVWDILETPATLEEIVGRLSETFEGDHDVMAQDVSTLLERLHGEGLVAVDP